MVCVVLLGGISLFVLRSKITQAERTASGPETKGLPM
jgi:hypothetical protein